MAGAKLKHPPQERLKFFAALGEALVHWAYIEYCLQRALGKFITGDPDSLPAASAYWAVVGSKARFDMVSHAAKMRLSPADYRRFNKMLDRCNKLQTTRNHLAHYYFSQDKVPRSDGYRYHSAPFYRDPNYYSYPSAGRPKKGKEYNVDDLKRFTRDVIDVGEDAFAFINNVKLMRTRRPPTISRATPP